MKLDKRAMGVALLVSAVSLVFAIWVNVSGIGIGLHGPVHVFRLNRDFVNRSLEELGRDAVQSGSSAGAAAEFVRGVVGCSRESQKCSVLVVNSDVYVFAAESFNSIYSERLERFERLPRLIREVGEVRQRVKDGLETQLLGSFPNNLACWLLTAKLNQGELDLFLAAVGERIPNVVEGCLGHATVVRMNQYFNQWKALKKEWGSTCSDLIRGWCDPARVIFGLHEATKAGPFVKEGYVARSAFGSVLGGFLLLKWILGSVGLGGVVYWYLSTRRFKES